MFAISYHAIVLLFVLLQQGEGGEVREAFRASEGQQVSYERFSEKGRSSQTLILLHGANGPKSPFYRDQAGYYAHHGFDVLLLHYFDVTHGPVTPSDSAYQAWSQVLLDLIRREHTREPGKRICVVGYSLGASVALAAASAAAPLLKAVVEWYGSMPDTFVERTTTLPPLLILHGADDSTVPLFNALQLERLCTLRKLTCSIHVYEGEGHGFSPQALKDAEARTLNFLADHD